MESTRLDLAPLRTVEVTTKVVIEVSAYGKTSLLDELGRQALDAMLRGDTITFVPFQ